MNRVNDELSRVLPLKVDEYQNISGVFLVLTGEEGKWSLAVTAAWEVLRRTVEGSLVSSGELPPDETGKRLLGHQLIAVDVGDDLRNPQFQFSDGTTLRVFSENGAEAWTLRVLGLPYVLVG